jgi:hypothetical protein
MGMYTDWGNLKIVSCRAWLEGRTRQLNVCTGGMDALGASILTLSGPGVRVWASAAPDQGQRSIGRCRNVQVF